MNTGRLKVAFFGKLADALGPELTVPVQGDCSVLDLRTLISEMNPEAAEALCDGRVRACVDDVIGPDGHVISPGSRVEFLPPVSGG